MGASWSQILPLQTNYGLTSSPFPRFLNTDQKLDVTEGPVHRCGSWKSVHKLGLKPVSLTTDFRHTLGRPETLNPKTLKP